MTASEHDAPERNTARSEVSRWERDGGPEASTSGSSTLQIRSRAGSTDLDDTHHPDGPIPVWLRESSKSFHWKWVPYPLRQFARTVVWWTEGPDPPQMQKITPFFPTIQETPVRFIARYFPRPMHKAALLALFIFCWLLTFSLVLHHSASAGNIKGYGKPQPIWCGASYWASGNKCGLNGNRCRPFDNANLAFRCPANCKAVHVLSPHAVGTQEINYQPFVIGGPAENEPAQSIADYIYRADSFVCQAAIHAGVVSNQKGGCGVVKLAGTHSNFTSTPQNGIESISFDAFFPKSFSFVSDLSPDCIRDLRWPLLAVTVIFTTILSLCTASTAIFFPTVFTLLFFHVGLVSDPPSTDSDYASLSSLIIGRFLPAAFVAAVFYRYTVKPQQRDLHAYFERTILWLGGAWVGSLNNYTFDFIPIQRLTPSDLAAQPGARLALVIVVVLLLSIAIGQIYYLRLEGRLPKYLGIYAIFITFLIVCVIVPSLNLRIHHYFLALLLLPGTRLQTRPSLLYQGILVGLFINGTARWGFDSILQTTAALRGDGQLHSLLPNVTAVASTASNITFSWTLPPFAKGFDGISMLVNDVERHRWYQGEGEPEHTFYRTDHEKEYFRFAYMRGSSTADFTKAGIWEGTGEWRKMEKGPSR
ncbi:MAG: hypothetical protein Q9204_005437 [Flavoplaca sp. TL-2023a]